MMAPRTMVSGSIFTNAPKSDAEIISDLRIELHHTHNELLHEKYKRWEAEATISVLRRNREKKVIVPMGDCEDGYWCPNLYCNVELRENIDNFCPKCGAEIDWRGLIPIYDEDTDAYDRRFDR